MNGTSRLRLVLAVLLLVGEPVAFAFYASSAYLRLLDRGPLAVAWLGARLVIVGVGIAAGMALWHHRPGALPLARTALVLAAGSVLVSVLTPIFPSNAPPGATAFLVIALLLYYAAWLWWLARQRD